MKAYKKSKCEFVDGRIVKGGNVIAIDKDVWKAIDLLEEQAQKAEYILSQPKACKQPSADGFKRKFGVKRIALDEPNTPALDDAMRRSLAIVEELDSIEVVNVVNETLSNMGELLEWIESKFVVDLGDNGTTKKLHLPTIGNPLDLTQKDVLDVLMKVASADRHVAGMCTVFAGDESED